MMAQLTRSSRCTPRRISGNSASGKLMPSAAMKTRYAVPNSARCAGSILIQSRNNGRMSIASVKRTAPIAAKLHTTVATSRLRPSASPVAVFSATAFCTATPNPKSSRIA